MRWKKLVKLMECYFESSSLILKRATINSEFEKIRRRKKRNLPYKLMISTTITTIITKTRPLQQTHHPIKDFNSLALTISTQPLLLFPQPFRFPYLLWANKTFTSAAAFQYQWYFLIESVMHHHHHRLLWQMKLSEFTWIFHIILPIIFHFFHYHQTGSCWTRALSHPGFLPLLLICHLTPSIIIPFHVSFHVTYYFRIFSNKYCLHTYT